MFHTSDVNEKNPELGHSIFAKLNIFMPRYAYMKNLKKLFLDRKTMIYNFLVWKIRCIEMFSFAVETFNVFIFAQKIVGKNK